MSHMPLGYRIENGKAVIHEENAAKVRLLFESYLAGQSLAAAAKTAGFRSYHKSISSILQNVHYLGDDFYPAIIDSDTFTAVGTEIIRRAVKLGRVFDRRKKPARVIPTVFQMSPITQQFEDPYEQATYVYSQIEVQHD
jgi:hypothetical protein